MPAKNLDKALQKIDRDRGKVREVLERELAREHEQASAASASVQEARSKLQDLEGRRPALASDVFGGKAEYSDLDTLDSEIDRVRRHLEVAEIAQAQATERAPAIEQRMEETAREAAEKRFNLYVAERGDKVAAVETAANELVTRLEELLPLAREHEQMHRDLGGAPAGRSYEDVVGEYLATRLRDYVTQAAVRTVWIAQDTPSLLAADPYPETLEQRHASREAETEQYDRAREQRAAHDEARDKQQRYDLRRAEIHAKYGYARDITRGVARRTQVDAITDDALRREFPVLFEEERRAAMDRRRVELRGLLGYTGEDLSDEERAQLEERVEEQIRDEYPAFSEAVAG